MRFQNRFVGASVVIAVALAGVASAQDYIIQPGDTLWGIAQRFGVSLSDLEKANPQFTNPNLIYPGQVCHIPGPQATPPSAPAPKSPPPPPKTHRKPTPPPASAPSPTLVTVATSSDGPEVQLSTPTRGDQLPTGACLVKGKAVDKAGIKMVTIDGQVATLAADGSFDETVTLKEGSNVIAIVATNKNGHSTDAQIGVVAGKFGDDVPDALAVRVSNQALDVGCKAATPLVLADLQKLNGKELAKDTVSPFGGVSITTTVTLDSITAQSPDVKVQGTSSGLAASLGVTNFEAKLPIEITASVFGANIHLNHTLDLHFASFSAKGTLGLSKTASGTLQVDASGLAVDYAPTLAADILGQQAVNDLNTLLKSLSSIIPGSPKLQFDEVGIVNKVIALVWQSGLKNTVDTRIANMIVTTGLRGLPLAVMGYQATLDYALDTVSVDANGISLSMGLDVALNLPDKHASKGALLVGGQAPALSGNAGIELAVAQDTVNLVLEQAWRKGLLDKTIDESLAQQLGMLLNVAHLQLLLPALNAVIPASAALEFQVCPGAAPIVTLGANGAATVEVTELKLSVAFTVNGKATVLFATDVHATIPAKFAYTNGALALTLSKPTFVFDLEKSIVPLPKIGVENVLDFVVPFAVQFAAGQFLGPIPLPQVSVLGATVQVNSLGTAGAQNDFLEVGLSVQ